MRKRDFKKEYRLSGLWRKDHGELFNGYGVSVLQEEKSSGDGCGDSCTIM